MSIQSLTMEALGLHFHQKHRQTTQLFQPHHLLLMQRVVRLTCLHHHQHCLVQKFQNQQHRLLDRKKIHLRHHQNHQKYQQQCLQLRNMLQHHHLLML